MFTLLFSATKIIINLIDTFARAFGLSNRVEVNDYPEIALFLLGFSIVSMALFFIVKAVALNTLFKRAGEKHAWLAYVPFANYYLLGKVTGKTRFLFLTFSNIGLLVAIFLPIDLFLGVALDSYYAFDEFFALVGSGTMALEITYETTPFINALSLIHEIISLVTLIFVVILDIAFLRKYSGRHLFVYSFLLSFAYAFDISMLIYLPVFACILVAVRNREPFDPAAYVRRRAEEQRKAAELAAKYEPFSEFNKNKPSDISISPLKQDIFVSNRSDKSDGDE